MLNASEGGEGWTVSVAGLAKSIGSGVLSLEVPELLCHLGIHLKNINLTHNR